MSDNGENILVIKLGAFGDFIQALGAMAAIRKHHRNDRVTLLTTRPFAEIARQSGYFNDVWVDRRPKWHEPFEWWTLREKLNSGNFTRVYDLQNNDRTCLYFHLLSPRPEWVGTARGASHRNESPLRTAGKAFEGHKQTLALAGISNVEPDSLVWMTGKNSFKLERPYVLIVPGGSARHPEKRWPAEYFSALCKKLAEDGFNTVLMGGETEFKISSMIQNGNPYCVDLTGQTDYGDIAELARTAAGAIGNDTGPIHIIAPTGCPTLVLFSKKTNPAKHGPLGETVSYLQRDRLQDLSLQDVYRAFMNLHRHRHTSS